MIHRMIRMSYEKMMLATLVVAVMAIPALMSPLATIDGSSIGTIDTDAEVIDILNGNTGL